MSEGRTIKMQRQIKKMSQEELADGIISTSYLSKIENNKAFANNETLKLLYSRLDLEYKDDNESWKNLCEEWFTLLQDYGNINEIQSKYTEIQDIKKDSSSEILITSINIHLIRYFCMTSLLDKALEQISFLKPLSSLFSDDQKYFFNKFQGNYYYLKGNYQSAYNFYRMAEKEKNNNLSLSNLENGDLLYSISLTLSKIRKPAEAITYALSALDIFKSNYHLKRCFQCHVTLGISYRRILNFEQAINQYHLALQLSKNLQDNSYLTLVYLNLGHLYFVKNNKNSAIEMYNLGLKHSNIITDVENHLLIILSLIKLYLNEGNKEKVENLIKTGLDKLESVENKNKFKGIKMEMEAHLSILHSEENKYIYIMEKEIIPYFISKHDYSKVVEYSNYLSNYYSEKKHYKKALKYERLINNLYSKQIYL